MADGDVHFVISAEDKASAVLTAFNGKMEAALSQLTSSMQDALGKMDSVAGKSTSAIEKLFEAIKNPSPMTVLAGAATAAGAAFLYLQQMVADADEEFKSANRGADAMVSTWQKLADLKFSNETAGMSAGGKDIATFNRDLDNTPLAGLSKEDRERREALKGNISKYGAFMGAGGQEGVVLQNWRKELADLDKKEAEGNAQETLLRNQAKQQNAEEVAKREAAARGAVGTKDFRTAMGTMGGQVADAQFAAKTAGMTDIQKKLAEFEKQWLNMDTSRMSSDQARQVNEAYVIERRRLETALELEASKKRQLESEAMFLDINKELDEADRTKRQNNSKMLAKAGADAKSSVRTPDQIYGGKVKDLMAMEMMGAIDKKTMDLGIDKARKERDDARNKGDKAGDGTNLVESRFRTRGSGNMDPQYKIAENTDRMAKAAERQAELMEEEKRNRNNNVGAQIAVGVF